MQQRSNLKIAIQIRTSDGDMAQNGLEVKQQGTDMDALLEPFHNYFKCAKVRTYIFISRRPRYNSLHIGEIGVGFRVHFLRNAIFGVLMRITISDDIVDSIPDAANIPVTVPQWPTVGQQTYNFNL